MNIFRNSLVVGALSVTAVALLIRNIPRTLSGRWPAPAASAKGADQNRASSPAVTAAPSLVPPGSIKKTSATGPVTSPSPRSALVEADATAWTAAPRRDPFGNRMDRKSSASPVLKLQAVWRQSGTNLAVINNQIITEGDQIDEFSVEKIEPDHVWLTGPNGRRGLRFELPGSEKVPSPSP
jgi:hypothetical protein